MWAIGVTQNKILIFSVELNTFLILRLIIAGSFKRQSVICHSSLALFIGQEIFRIWFMASWLRGLNPGSFPQSPHDQIQPRSLRPFRITGVLFLHGWLKFSWVVLNKATYVQVARTNYQGILIWKWCCCIAVSFILSNMFYLRMECLCMEKMVTFLWMGFQIHLRLNFNVIICCWSQIKCHAVVCTSILWKFQLQRT